MAYILAKKQDTHYTVKKVFYETLKGSSAVPAGRTF